MARLSFAFIISISGASILVIKSELLESTDITNPLRDIFAKALQYFTYSSASATAFPAFMATVLLVASDMFFKVDNSSRVGTNISRAAFVIESLYFM